MAAADELLQDYITDPTRMYCYSAIKSLIQRLEKLFHDCFLFISGRSGFTFGSPAPTTTPVTPGGFSLASAITNSTSSPFTGTFTLGKTSASTGTSNTGFTFGGGLLQPTELSTFLTPKTQAGGFTFVRAPFQGCTLEANKTTAPATVDPTPTFAAPAPTTTPVAPGGISLASANTNGTSSPFTGGITVCKTSASTGASNTGFTFGGGLTQPPGLSTFVIPNTQASGFVSAPLQSFTLEANKTTTPATVNPTPAFTAPAPTTTPAYSASSGLTLTSDNVGGNPTSGLTLGATAVTTTTRGLSLGSGFKLGGTAATPAGTGFTLSVPAASSATPIIGSLSGLATTPAATASGVTASTGLPLGTTGTSTAPGFSFGAVSGLKFGSTQTTSLSTATTTG